MRKSGRVVNEGDHVFVWHFHAAAIVLVAVKSHSCPSWRLQRLSLVGQLISWIAALLTKLLWWKVSSSVTFPLIAFAFHCISCRQLVGVGVESGPGWWWWWCRPHPVREHAQDLRPPLGARPASPPTRQAAQPPPRGPSTNPRPLV